MQETNEQLASRAQGGDEAALLELLAQTRRLVFMVVNRWGREVNGLTREDLAQEGFLGFLHAVRAFDSSSGIQFSSYVVNAVRWRLLSAMGLHGEKAKGELLRAYTSLDAPASPDAPEGSTLAELIPDPEAEANIDGAALRLEVAAVLEGLTEAQRRAVYDRFWLDKDVDRKDLTAALRFLRHPSRSKRLRQLL